MKKYDRNAAAGKGHNKSRRAKMQRASEGKLIDFVKAKTLSSAAAEYELRARNGGQLPKAFFA